MLGKLPVPGRPSNFADSRARAYCACSGCGWGLFGNFYFHLSFLSSFSLSLGYGQIKTELLSQRTVKPKTTNQPIYFYRFLYLHITNLVIFRKNNVDKTVNVEQTAPKDHSYRVYIV